MMPQTWAFALFFIVAWAGYVAVKGTRLRLPWLVAVSYAFYACWNPWYLALLAYATAVDYCVVLAMARSQRKKAWLALSVLNGLLLLGFFKYAGFLAESASSMLAWLGVPYRVPSPDLPWPVGISFYVFRSLTYTIDAYRGKVEREPSLLRYAAFVSFFPELMMGPIERAGSLLPQLREAPRITRDDVADGLSLFVLGLFKKVVLADYLSLYVSKVYATPGRFDAPALLLATFAFSWQIYFDFSGYTDMARGIGRMMGFRLMLNFDNPYLATGLGDFWRRWHIGLSTWFRDYFYIPLGGNRKGELRTYLNMALTMLVSGLWHGANWTYVIWGGIHALGRVLTRRLEAARFYAGPAPDRVKGHWGLACVSFGWTFVRRLWVFAFVSFAWIFFNAKSVSDAWLIVRRIFTAGWTDPAFPLLAAGLVLAVWAYQFAYESRLRWILGLAPVRIALVVIMALCVGLFGRSGGQGFIYLQF